MLTPTRRAPGSTPLAPAQAGQTACFRGPIGPAKGAIKMNFDVAPLPYAKDALEPVMSRETFEYHYEKHHKAYMAKLKRDRR